MTVSVTPPEGIAAGEYDISCSAVSAEETLSTDLKVVITGSYGLKVGTPDGRLSFDAYAGKESDVTLNVTNTGNVDLQDVSFKFLPAIGWTVTYNLENNVIPSIPAGSTTEVIAHVKPGSEGHHRRLCEYLYGKNVSRQGIQRGFPCVREDQHYLGHRGGRNHPVYRRRTGLRVP